MDQHAGLEQDAGRRMECAVRTAARPGEEARSRLSGLLLHARDVLPGLVSPVLLLHARDVLPGLVSPVLLLHARDGDSGLDHSGPVESKGVLAWLSIILHLLWIFELSNTSHHLIVCSNT
ncbi:Uncharacterized protein Rs2_09767 [Raphanus sativus]|nr:Uncharacterized protein Rs2_09767 [Raphanus sativus]